jgi:hypothetical protein
MELNKTQRPAGQAPSISRSGAQRARSLEGGDRLALSSPCRILDIAALEPPQPADVIAAQRLVCSELVIACEQALLAVRVETGRATTSTDVRRGLMAADLLESVLASWRETRELLTDCGQ